jgi:AMIN domain
MAPVVLALAITLLSVTHAGGQDKPLTLPVVVRDVAIDTQQPGTVVLIKTSRLPRYSGSLIGNPPRLVIDFTEATFAWAQTRLPVKGADVKEVRGSQFRKGVARIVIELVQSTSYTIEPHIGGLQVAIGQAPSQARRPEPRPGIVIAPAHSSPIAAVPDANRPRLQGIVLRETGGVAYIQNPRTNVVAGYRVGEAVEGSILQKIEEDRVVLKGPDATVVLRIAPLPRKKP